MCVCMCVCVRIVMSVCLCVYRHERVSVYRHERAYCHEHVRIVISVCLYAYRHQLPHAYDAVETDPYAVATSRTAMMHHPRHSHHSARLSHLVASGVIPPHHCSINIARHHTIPHCAAH